MACASPKKLVLRCYGRATEDGNWYGVCVDLNLAAEADSLKALKKKLGKMIEGYIKVVLDTDDKASIPRLLKRRAPWKDYLTYYCIKFMHYFIRPRGSEPFKLAEKYC